MDPDQSSALRVDGFSGWMRDAISEAGLPLDCKPDGLRKAAGRLLAEAGAMAKMITLILGHTTHAGAERRIEEADQASRAADAVINLEGHKASKFSQTAFPVWENTTRSRHLHSSPNSGVELESFRVALCLAARDMHLCPSKGV